VVYLAAGTVRFNVKGTAADQSDIVGQARVGNGVVLGQQNVFPGEGVQVWHLFAINDSRIVAIFQNDDDHVIEIGNLTRLEDYRKSGLSLLCSCLSSRAAGQQNCKQKDKTQYFLHQANYKRIYFFASLLEQRFFIFRPFVDRFDWKFHMLLGYL
jgi:hypothetical protein